MQLESYKCSLQIVLIILVNICLQALLLHKKKGRKEKEERKRRQERKREGKEARKRERKREGRRKKERKRETDKPQREEGIPWQLRENTVAKIPQYIHVNHPIQKYLEQELKILRPPK